MDEEGVGGGRRVRVVSLEPIGPAVEDVLIQIFDLRIPPAAIGAAAADPPWLVARPEQLLAVALRAFALLQPVTGPFEFEVLLEALEHFCFDVVAHGEGVGLSGKGKPFRRDAPVA